MPGWYSFSKVIVEVIDETCEDGFAQKTKSSITESYVPYMD